MHARSLSRLAALPLAATLPFALPAPAHANKDFCISTGGAVILSAKKFKLPKKGQCASFLGYCPGPVCTGIQNAITGSACAADDGTKVLFAIAYMFHGAGASRELHTIQLDPVALTGTMRILQLTTAGNFENTVNVTAAACTAPPLP